MFHLPDLPIVGYSTRKEREGTDAIMDFLRKIERDRPRLLMTVANGPDLWRKIAGDIFRGSSVPESLDEMYWYLMLMAAKPFDQRRMLEARRNASETRDVMNSIRVDIEAQLVEAQLAKKWSPFRAS